MKTKIQSLLILLALLASLRQTTAQGTAFTYQGRLNDGANPANGSYDLAFTLFATNTGGICYRWAGNKHSSGSDERSFHNTG